MPEDPTDLVQGALDLHIEERLLAPRGAESSRPQAGTERGARQRRARGSSAQGKNRARGPPARPEGCGRTDLVPAAERGGGAKPLLGAHLQGGERELALRRAGGSVRLPLHQPRLELRLLLAHAVLPVAARLHAPRAALEARPGSKAQPARALEVEGGGWNQNVPTRASPPGLTENETRGAVTAS